MEGGTDQMRQSTLNAAHGSVGRSVAAASAVVVAVLMVSATENGARADILRYMGSSTVGLFIVDASAEYRRAIFKIDTRTESDGGEACIPRAACDIGGVARALSGARSGDVAVTLIGRDVITALVNADNPVKALTSAQLKGIFTGAITNWRELGGHDLEIHPLIVKEGSATRDVFRAVVMDDADYRGARVIVPDALIPTAVARDPGAIGQLSFAFLPRAHGVIAIAVDGQAAKVDNAAYPITRPLNLVTSYRPPAAVKAFIDWTLSVDGQRVVKRNFIGIH